MSEPARIGTWRSATALVRVNRGSTWTSLAPLSLAFMGQRNATGWHSAMFEPITTKQSVCSRLRGYRFASEVADLAVTGARQGRAPDHAERANPRRRLGFLDPQLLPPRNGRRERHAEPDESADRGPRSSAGRELQEIPPTDLHGILPA